MINDDNLVTTLGTIFLVSAIYRRFLHKQIPNFGQPQQRSKLTTAVTAQNKVFVCAKIY